MATTPNAQLTKLALGIASVAALAGITGRLSGGAVKAQPNVPAAQGATLPADQTYQQVVKPTLPEWAQQPAPAPAEAPRYESREHGDDNDEEEWEEEEGEHEGRSFLFFGSQTGATGTQAGQTQRRSRSGHS